LSTIHQISTNLSIISNLKSLNIKQTTTYGIGNPGHHLGQTSNSEVVRVCSFRF